MKKSNIVLIGMPSSGKSTVGTALAEELNMNFIDTDTVIFEGEGKELRDIVIDDGLKRFLELQKQYITALDVKEHIVATGGSVIYSEDSMMHLKENGVVIYLKVDYTEVEQRITSERKFAREEGKSFLDLYNERAPLYEKYADITIESTGKEVNEIVNDIKIVCK